MTTRSLNGTSHTADQTESQASPAPKADLRWLWRFVRNHRRATIGAIVSGMFGGVFAAAQPYLVGVIIDHIREGVTTQQLIIDSLLLVTFGLLTVVAFFGQRFFSGVVAYSVNYDAREVLFDNMLTLDQSFYQQYATGDLISRMHTDVEMTWRLLAITLNRAGSAVTTLIFAFILLSMVNLPLTIIVFIVLTISTSFQIRAGRILTPVFEEVQAQAGTVAALVQDSVSGIKTIKTTGTEAGVASKFAEQNREYRRRWLYFKRRNEPVGLLPNMISELTAATVVIFGGFMVVEGAMTVGNFVQFLLYLATISTVLLQLGTIYQRYQQTRGALQRLTPLLQSANIQSGANAHPLPKPRGEIRFEDVSLMLDDTPILQDIFLHIEPGEVVAIVGPTGCGKTMLVNLIARVLDPTEGRVYVDDVDVRDLDLDALRAASAFVPQATFLFSQELYKNVRMGTDDFNDNALDQAIHISRMSNDLPQLPQGLDTLVGEKGVMLSGGQKQRVAIARAIIRDPAILVLDDALSSVDTQTAAAILSDLRQVLESRTSILIAHRIATVKDADRIYVMDEGRIIEAGTHDELVLQGGMYARMVDREMREEDLLYGTGD